MGEDEVEPTMVEEDHANGKKLLRIKFFTENGELCLRRSRVLCSAGKENGNDLLVGSEVDTSSSHVRRCVSCMCLLLPLLACEASSGLKMIFLI